MTDRPSMHELGIVKVFDLDASRYKGVEEVYNLVFLGPDEVLLRDSNRKVSVVKRDGDFLRRFAFDDDGLNEARLLDAEEDLSTKLDGMLYKGYERDFDFILEIGKLKDVHKQKQDRLQRVFGLEDIDVREDRILYYEKEYSVDDFLRDVVFPLRDSKDHTNYVLGVVKYLENVFQHTLIHREYELGMTHKRLREKERVTKWDERHAKYLEQRVEELDLTLTRLEAVRGGEHHDHDLFYEPEEKEERYWNFGRVCDYAVKGVAFATLALMFGLPASCVMDNYDRIINDPLSFFNTGSSIVAEADAISTIY